MEKHYATLWESLADAIGDREALVCGKADYAWARKTVEEALGQPTR